VPYADTCDKIRTMLAILKDAASRPDLFHWFGAIEREQIESWLRSSSLEVPSDLLDFWTQTGGGDLFEDSETMFRPTPIPTTVPYFVPGDDIDTANQHRVSNGLSKAYLAFHDGTFLSAIRLADQTLVTMNEEHEEIAVFSDLDDWYLRTLRDLHASHYRLVT
jgi:hypothetical protein